MYVYFNKSYEATTVIPHGEILRQGGDLNLYVCFDEKLDYNTSLICTIDMNGEKTPLVYITDGYFTFNKIKDSEITYDLIDGKRYWRLYFKATPEVATVYSGKINVSFEINKPDGKNYSATIPLYVEKTFGYSLDKTNLSKDEYEKLWELINTINGTKISYGDGIVTKNKTESFNENDENKLFIDEETGDIFTVEYKNREFVAKIINIGKEELDNILKNSFQENLIIDDEPMEGSSNLVSSGGVYDAIPHIKGESDNEQNLTKLEIDDEEFKIPIFDFELETNDDGKLTKIKIDDAEYNVDTLDNLETSDSPNEFDDKPIKSKGVFNALQEKSKVELSKDGGYLKEISVDGDTAEIPIVDFEIVEEKPVGVPTIDFVGLKINGQIFIIKNTTNNGSGGSVKVDDELLSTSENPVQNKIVKAAIDKKADKITLQNSYYDKTLVNQLLLTKQDARETDVTPQDDSFHWVTSGGVKKYVDDKVSAVGRSTSYVFETFDELKSSLYTKDKYKVGDNLYIKAKNVPDYWVCDEYTSSSTNESTGRYGYYMIAELESKIDLADYPTTKDLNDAIAAAITNVLNEDV